MFPVLIIGGATGSGKNRVALQLSDRYPIEIINADSRQIYRDLPIGTNQPSLQEQSLAPHHLFGFLSPDRPFSAAEYERLSFRLAREIQASGKLPVVVGGTGFYIRALLKGAWEVPPKDPLLRERLRQIAERKGPDSIQRLLQRLDPEAAKRISPNDVYRMQRAIEMRVQTGKMRSEWDQQRPDRFQAVKFYIDPPAEQLNRNLKSRTAAMFDAGWVEEVEHLLDKYPGFETMPAAASLGYPEIVRYLKGEQTLNECKQKIQLKTRQYAKRQRTWFRNQDGFSKLPDGDELHKIVESLQLRWGN